MTFPTRTERKNPPRAGGAVMGGGRLLAWHGDAKLKAATVAEMAEHRKADRLVKGQYWEGGKGCAVGCLVKGSNHSLYEPRFGIPVALAHLEDVIFENLPNGDAMKWPERFLSAAEPGADLSLVEWKFLDFVVTEALSREQARSVRDACQPALDAVRAKARGEDVLTDTAWSAADTAWSAADTAWNAACSAANAAANAASAAWSASSAARSTSTTWSVECAAWSAANAESAARRASSAASAARRAAWKLYASKLVELMKAAPVVGEPL